MSLHKMDNINRNQTHYQQLTSRCKINSVSKQVPRINYKVLITNMSCLSEICKGNVLSFHVLLLLVISLIIKRVCRQHSISQQFVQGRNQSGAVDEARSCSGVLEACPPEMFKIQKLWNSSKDIFSRRISWEKSILFNWGSFSQQKIFCFLFGVKM